MKFYKIGFYISTILLIVVIFVMFKLNPTLNQGSASWIDIYSNNSVETMQFLSDNFGIEKDEVVKTEGGQDYVIIKSSGSLLPFAGIMQMNDDMKKQGFVPHSTIYLTVKDYEVIHKKIIADGAIAVIDHKHANNMIFGIYIIPGGLDIGIIEYTK